MNKLISKLKSVVKFTAHLCREAIKAVDEVAEVVADKICDVFEGVSWTRAAKIAVPAAVLLISGVSAFADSTFADPSTITTTATTVFTAVATLMVGIVGFWVVLKIVRKISGK